MPETKWRTDTGNTSNAAKWDAGVPSNTVDALFDAGSFTAASQVVTVDATASCKDMNWTGATNTPTLRSTSAHVMCYGSPTLIANMIVNITGDYGFYFLGSGARVFTTNGLSFVGSLLLDAGFSGSFTFADNYTTTSRIGFDGGTLNTNGKTVSITYINMSSAVARTLTLGSSTLNLSGASGWLYDGSNLTLTANTSTINCAGNFSGGGVTTYNIVNLTGATSTMTGNNTIQTLTRTGTAAASTWVLADNQAVLDVCTITGNSAVNTMTVSSSVAGTKRRILARKFVLTNVILSADIELGIYDGGAGGYSMRTQPETGAVPDTTTLQDGSRNKSSGTMTAVTWVRQASGLWAMSFDGATSKVTYPASLNTVRTASVWVKPSANTRSIMDFDGGYHSLEISATNTITALGWYNPIVYVNGVATTAIALNVWSLVTVTTANGFTASAPVLGKEATWYSGLMALPQNKTYTMSAGQVYKDYEASRRWFNA